MGGYRFLMRYYSPEDDIYFFGFSRGAYTARFLAEMLDHVGLLTAGNEEFTRFAWKTFSKWQARRGGNSPAQKEEADRVYERLPGNIQSTCTSNTIFGLVRHRQQCAEVRVRNDAKIQVPIHRSVKRESDPSCCLFERKTRQISPGPCHWFQT